jgi:trehalose/maltose hydrolase-like predicted phosphorylase
MTTWTLTYDGYDAEQEGLREALCTLGNGYFATRGAGEEVEADAHHYPGTYLAGGYDRLVTDIAGRHIESEDLVNVPNWLPLSFRPEDGDWFNLRAVELLHYRQQLNLRVGILRREIHFRDRHGRESRILTRRLVHMGAPHLAAIEWVFTPLNWSGAILVRSALDGRVINSGVARYSELARTHLVPLDARAVDGETMLLVVRTRQSQLTIAEAARTRAYRSEAEVDLARTLVVEEGYISHTFRLDVSPQDPVRIEKVVALFTGRDHAISEPGLAAVEEVRHAGRFPELVERQTRAWRRLWSRCDVMLEGEERMQMILRLHIFHLLQTVSHHSADLDVGVPARGLHGEAYRGHIFWDELFIVPFLTLRIPVITRSLLRYRHRRLGAARRLAQQAGFDGVMFPWQSGSDGREESQQLHLNPRSGRWLPDNTHLQRHVNAAIAYNVWRYFQTTHDREFLSFYGAEMLIEISRFFASAVSWNEARKRHELRGVMGPDEFHDAYPWSDSPGIDNNAYTNVMVSWVLAQTLGALAEIGPVRRRELSEQLQLKAGEPETWDRISRTMFVPFHDGIPEQFEGYERLEEFDWNGYRERYGDIRRLDRLLEAEGSSVNRYKASKQADVLMLFYLFSAEELAQLFGRLDYPFSGEMIPRTIEYYLARTSNGSTLSQVVHSWVLARSDRPRSWALLNEALKSDFADVQGGTTPEGIHLGAMAGTINLLQIGQTGLELLDDGLRFNPCLAEGLEGLMLKLRYRSHWLEIVLHHDRFILHAPNGWPEDARIMVREKTFPFGTGQRLVLRKEREGPGWVRESEGLAHASDGLTGDAASPPP